MKYKTRKVVVDAFQYTGKNSPKVKAWLLEVQGDDAKPDTAPFVTKNGNTQAWNAIKDDEWGTDIVAAVYDYLHETWVGVKRGQWIIYGTAKELYPCDPDVFDTKYAEADDTSEVDNAVAAVHALYPGSGAWRGANLQDIIEAAFNSAR